MSKYNSKNLKEYIKRLIKFLLVVTCIYGCAQTYPLESDSAEKIPIKQFIQWPRFNSVKISPNGYILTVQVAVGDGFSIRYFNLASDNKLSGHESQYKASDIYYEWVDGDNIIIGQYIPPGGERLLLYNSKTDKTKTLLSTYARGRISYLGISKNKKYLFVSGGEFNEHKSTHKRNSVFRIAIKNGEIEEWIENDWEIDSWHTDRQADLWVGYRKEGKIVTVYSYDNGTEKLVKIYEAYPC